jgi:lipopolysaccharide/colanic/teichoic acid biosynthesis glycosyltransferase
MVKRIFDISLAIVGVILFLPIILAALTAIFLEEFGNPFYQSYRIGLNAKPFRIFKLRTMRLGSEKSKVDSTSSNDPRLTRVGKIIRKLKIDELPQVFNVLIGNMSFVGPRPNVKREVELYTNLEKDLLKVKPGVTDISSIVFSDLNEILADSHNPNLDYNQFIRPHKSRLGLLYIKNRNIIIDIKLILITLCNSISRKKALTHLSRLTFDLSHDKELCEIVLRKIPLSPSAPPGRSDIVTENECKR